MANNLLAFSPEYRSARAQFLLKKMLVAREISNMEERSTLKNGIKVHRPYHSDVKVNTYTKGTNVTPQDITVTDEYLTVDQTKEATVYIDDIDVIQNDYNTANLLVDRITYALKRDIDGAFLAEVANAAFAIDDATFSGGTASNGITATVSNVFKLFTTAEATLNNNNVEDTKPWFAVITPDLKALIQQTNLFNGFNQADAALHGTLKGMGYLATWGNFNVFVSNNVKHTITFTSATLLVATNVVTINGVAFTIVASGGSASTAGDVSLVGTSVANTLTNLAAAINGTGTPWSSTYIEISAANRAKLNQSGCVATATATTITFVFQGKPTVSYTGSVSGTAWGTAISHCWFGQYGATDLVIQSDVKVQNNKDPLKTGFNYLCYTLYGIKTFNEGAQRGVRVLVNN